MRSRTFNWEFKVAAVSRMSWRPDVNRVYGDVVRICVQSETMGSGPDKTTQMWPPKPEFEKSGLASIRFT